jgi:hypothetical protein
MDSNLTRSELSNRWLRYGFRAGGTIGLIFDFYVLINMLVQGPATSDLFAFPIFLAVLALLPVAVVICALLGGVAGIIGAKFGSR